MIIINCGVFHLRSDNIYENVIKTYKSYNVRPLAFITDAFVFSWFWDNMYTLLLIMLIMHVANLYFIYKICEKIEIKLNAFCMILFAFAPLLIEALYWISASTRIVFSLFLCLASIYLLLQSFDEENSVKKLIKFYGAILLNLLCVGYYEQTIALNLFLFLFVLICLRKYKYMFIPIISTTWIGIWYIHFMINGKMQSRGSLNLSGIIETLKDCLIMIKDRFELAYSNFINSLGWGTEAILTSFVSIVLLGLVSYTIYYMYKNKCLKNENKKMLRKIILGSMLFISPYLPFLVLETNYIAMRNMYLPFLGFTIILEVIFDLVLTLVKSDKSINIIKTSVAGFLLIIFVIANIEGVNNYRKVNDLDTKVVSQIINAIPDEAFENKKTISINYDVDELYRYKNLSNYVESVIESDWATMGKIQVLRGKTNVGNVFINSKQKEADYAFYFDENVNLK